MDDANKIERIDQIEPQKGNDFLDVQFRDKEWAARSYADQSPIATLEEKRVIVI
jgi:hypothetical protein